MAFENEENPVKRLYDEITELRIIEGRISTGPTIYEFHMQGGVIRVCAEKLDSPREFRKQYQKIMFEPAIRCNNRQWDQFLRELGNKRNFQHDPEESEYEFIAREIFDSICDYEITTYSFDILNGFLYDYKDHLYLTSKVIRDIIDNHGFHIAFKTLSSTMTELGMKKAGTERITIDGKQIRCWAFIPSKVEEVKGIDNQDTI